MQTSVQESYSTENQSEMLNLSLLEATSVAEQAAIACYDFIGRGDEKAADRAAVDAMRTKLNQINLNGKVVIGEGERDEAPMLYIGEKVGTGKGPNIDIALDPLEGTTICAEGRPNSLAVIAFTEEGGFLHAPDVYMEKIAVGPFLPKEIVSLENTPTENLKNLAMAKKCNVKDLRVTILKRSRHENLIAEIREAGAIVNLISDGDIAGVISTYNGDTDMYIGTGGAPEGVLAAAALKVIGGQIQGKLLFNNDEQIARAARMGIDDPNKIYSTNEMAKGKNILFVATGVTDGELLNGVKCTQNYVETQTLILSSADKSMRVITNKKLK